MVLPPQPVALMADPVRMAQVLGNLLSNAAKYTPPGGTIRLVAQQEAERSKFVVMKADQERRAAVIRAEGESEAAQLISDATAKAGMGLIELRRIEASREVAATLARSPNVAYLPGGQSMLFSLNR